MSTLILLTITGVGLGAMYFLIASGLSLIYGLMGVLNFEHRADAVEDVHARPPGGVPADGDERAVREVQDRATSSRCS